MMTLAPHPKPLSKDARAAHLQATHDRYARLVDPFVGLFYAAQVHEPGTLRLRYHATVGLRILPPPTTSLQALYVNDHTSSAGIGGSPQEVLLKGVSEGLERLAAVPDGSEELLLASYDELVAQDLEAIHPEALFGYHDEQYANRDAWNEAHPFPELHVPAPYDAGRRIHWVQARNLTAGSDAYLPAAYVYLHFAREDPPVYLANSNGNAAHTSMTAALYGGITEVMERDTVTQWFANRLRVPGVDLASFADHPHFAEQQRRHKALGRDLHVLDVTADLAPTFVAVSVRRGGPPYDIIFGAGADLNPVEAIDHALAELELIFDNVHFVHADGQVGYHPKLDPLRRHWFEHLPLESYLEPSGPLRSAPDYASQASPTDVRDDVERLIETARAAGLDVLAVPLFVDGVDVAAVKVVIPGTSFWCNQYGHERLRQVPVEMGRLPRVKTLDELNPWPILL